MAVEGNLITTTEVAPVQAIDFVNRFGENLNKLIEALGITRKIPMNVGDTLLRYAAAEVELGEQVVEGEIIPLSKVTAVPATPIEIALKKYRKSVTAEAIQKAGYDKAVADTDDALLRELQRAVRTELFDFVTTEAVATVAYEPGLQGALATAWGQVETLFEDDGADTIAFVNPIDVAKYNGAAQITMQKEFGMNFVEGFLNAKVVTNTSVPAGEIYATAAENLVMAYVPMAGDVGRAFNLTGDQTGLIGISHYNEGNRATIDSLVISGLTLFTERADGLVKVVITDAPAG